MSGKYTHTKKNKKTSAVEQTLHFALHQQSWRARGKKKEKERLLKRGGEEWEWGFDVLFFFSAPVALIIESRAKPRCLLLSLSFSLPPPSDIDMRKHHRCGRVKGASIGGICDITALKKPDFSELLTESQRYHTATLALSFLSYMFAFIAMLNIPLCAFLSCIPTPCCYAVPTVTCTMVCEHVYWFVCFCAIKKKKKATNVTLNVNVNVCLHL